MASFGSPLIAQGNLNRVITHILFPNNLPLSVTAPFMAKGMANFTHEAQIVDQIGSATGIVNSPNVYVLGHFDLALLRSQGLAAAWLAQVQENAQIGTAVGYSDTDTYPPITLLNASIITHNPGPWDGTDPTCRFTVSGEFLINAAMWLGAT